jgi:hypothetical protein
VEMKTDEMVFVAEVALHIKRHLHKKSGFCTKSR